MKEFIRTLLASTTILLIAWLALWTASEMDSLRQDVSNAGDGWYQTLGALKLALERIDTLEQELANEELFSEYVRLELAWEQRRIPERCTEDVFIQGIGDFEAGQYQAYECGPAMDDFLPPRIIGE